MTLPGLAWLHASGFAHPAMFAALVIPLVLVVLHVVAQRRRRRRLRTFAGIMAPAATPSRRARLLGATPLILSVLAVTLLVVFLAGPLGSARVPRNRAVIMLAIDVSESMAAADVDPTRLGAAQKAATDFARGLTPGVNLGLVAFSGDAYLLVSPTIDHDATVNALGKLTPDDGTATGEALFTALQAIATVGDVLATPDGSKAPASIVLLSDGAENRPTNPNNPRGAYTAARLARQQGVPISTISIGTPSGYVTLDGQSVAVPVDDSLMRDVADLSGGQVYHATDVQDLANGYAAAERQQIGYQTIPAPTATGWLRAATLLLTAAALAALVFHRRLPA